MEGYQYQRASVFCSTLRPFKQPQVDFNGRFGHLRHLLGARAAVVGVAFGERARLVGFILPQRDSEGIDRST